MFGSGVDFAVGLTVSSKESVSLRPTDDGCAILTIGREFEALLAAPHLIALREQIDPALACLRSLDAAHTAIVEVQERAATMTRVADTELSQLDAAITAAWAALEVAEQAAGSPDHIEGGRK